MGLPGILLTMIKEESVDGAEADTSMAAMSANKENKYNFFIKSPPAFRQSAAVPCFELMTIPNIHANKSSGRSQGKILFLIKLIRLDPLEMDID